MRRCRRGIKLLAIVICALLCASLPYALFSAPIFDMGYGYELYCGTSSAEIIRTETPALTKLLRFDVKGESVRYEGNRYDALKEKFAAELLFVEEAAGVTNYYMYSEQLKGGVLLGGHLVNLHIAVSCNQTAVGTPLIFGGF